MDTAAVVRTQRGLQGQQSGRGGGEPGQHGAEVGEHLPHPQPFLQVCLEPVHGRKGQAEAGGWLDR
ncbi:hypothetical protein ACFYZ5_46700 [Streptomyces chartreusis]|uniref:hypothetical protein n=1 Tax=Streptomyces chartreusis TaxID=1969 RepID=UPI0036B5A192